MKSIISSRVRKIYTAFTRDSIHLRKTNFLRPSGWKLKIIDAQGIFLFTRWFSYCFYSSHVRHTWHVRQVKRKVGTRLIGRARAGFKDNLVKGEGGCRGNLEEFERRGAMTNSEGERETERDTDRERERERERVYSAHSSARSIGECLGKRTWTTHTVPRDHRASPLAYIRLHGSPKTIPWPFSTDRPVVH